MVQNNVQSTRHDGIVEAVIDAGSMRIDELAELFDVSRMTVHRDLDALEARGVLRKSRGVVTAVASNLFEASAEYRTRQNRSEKAAIASAALAQITPVRSSIETSALVELNGVEISDSDSVSDSQDSTLAPLGSISATASISNSDGNFDSSSQCSAVFFDELSGVFNASGGFAGTQTDPTPDATSYLHAVNSVFQYDFSTQDPGTLTLSGTFFNGGPFATSFIGSAHLYTERVPGEGFTVPIATTIFDFDGSGSEFEVTHPLNSPTGNYRIEFIIDHIGLGMLNTDSSAGSISAFFSIIPDPCPADFTGDGALNIFDVFAFLDAFESMDASADFTGDGVFDIFDVFAYLDAFTAGCP